jgi:hypothetical protein
MAKRAVPTGGGLNSALDFLSTPGKMGKTFREVIPFVQEMIGIVRTASEPNPFKNATDEEIATELVRLINERKEKKKHGT